MTILSPPPIYDNIVGDDGKVTKSWALYFNDQYNGDHGSSWTPIATSLGSTGTPVLTGIIYQITKKLCVFRIVVTPATNTTSTAGTTYFTGLPVTVIANGFCTAQSSNLGDPTGEVVASSGRIYTPAWTNVAVAVTITGLIEAS